MPTRFILPHDEYAAGNGGDRRAIEEYGFLALHAALGARKAQSTGGIDPEPQPKAPPQAPGGKQAPR